MQCAVRVAHDMRACVHVHVRVRVRVRVYGRAAWRKYLELVLIAKGCLGRRSPVLTLCGTCAGPMLTVPQGVPRTTQRPPHSWHGTLSTSGTVQPTHASHSKRGIFWTISRTFG